MHGLQKARNKELEARVEALLNERDVLKGRVQQLKVSLPLMLLQRLHAGCRCRQACSSITSPTVCLQCVATEITREEACR